MNAAARHPNTKAVDVVIATVAPLGARRASELSGEDDDRLIQQAASIEILEQSRDRLIDLQTVTFVVGLQTAVGIPDTRPAGTVLNLNEPHAALDEPPRRQQLLPNSRQWG